MLSRRHFVAALVAAPLLGVAAPKAAPTWWRGDTVADAGPGTISARRSDTRMVNAKLAAQITPRSIDIVSANNANTTFVLWVTFPKQPEQEVFLSAGGTWFHSESFGHDTTGTQASFTLDRATAERLAPLLKVRLNERAKLDDALTASFTFPSRASTRKDDPIPVKLKVTNTSATATIGFAIGGRQRGARDNRFSFSISRNGKPIATIDAFDFGGLMYYKALKPGESTDLSVDLRSWAELTTPGHYEIDAQYEGELAKDGVMPTTAVDRKNLWDVRLLGRGGILVQ